MPIYEYICEDCGTRYEQLVLSKSAQIACPKCASRRHALQLSVFNSTGKSSDAPNGSSSAGASCACTPRTCSCH